MSLTIGSLTFGSLTIGRRLLVVLAALCGVAGCSVARLNAPPRDVTDTLPVLGIPNARFWIDRGPEAIVQEATLSTTREAQFITPGPNGERPTANFLSLSGGSDNGAFGAGLMVGWTAHGDRPQFRLVTGVSTGNLIAPFAYLGPAYDEQLKTVFTTVNQQNIFRNRGFTAALMDDALADTTPLFTLISKYVNEQMMADIAREYGKGRLLLTGTTNIDLQRPVLWNIGAIAASGQPGSLNLIRKIILASASIPGAFPPVMIDVEYEGKKYQEMHVDGGAVAQAFLYPAALELDVMGRKAGITRQRVGYVIRNGRIDPDWADTDRRFLNIAGRAVSTMIHYSGINDILRMYFTAVRDGVKFRLAFIPSEFKAEKKEEFDPVYMAALFNFAYEKARVGYPWLSVPVGLPAPAEAAPPVRPARPGPVRSFLPQ